MSDIIRVFIENEVGSDKKNIFDEKTLQYKKTVQVSRKVPYPYGFILNTTADDGGNVDCFILTVRKLKTGDIVEVVPIGIMLQTENDEEDNNVLAIFPDEPLMTVTNMIKSRLTEFITHVLDHRKDKTVTVGGFLDKNSAVEYINSHLD